MKGYIVKDKDIYYRGSVFGCRFGGFYDAKIYKHYKWALKALQHIKRRWNNFSIYEVDVNIIREVSEVEE